MNGGAFLGIDVGSSSIKIAVTDGEGEILASGSRPHAVRAPEPGWAEFDPELLWRLVVSLIGDLAGGRDGLLGSVKAIGLSVFCPGLIALGAGGAPLSPIIAFSDTRSVDDACMLADTLTPEKVFEVSGNRLMPGACSATSMAWIRRCSPDVYARTHVFGHLNTYLGARLTGTFGIDPSNASYTGFFRTGGTGRNDDWSSEMTALAGIEEEKLPPIVASHESLGELSNKELIDLGLRPGIPVAMGGGDTACSALAVGAINHNDLFESVGTSNVITICSETPGFDDRFMNRRHVLPGRWLYHGAMSSAGASLLWLRDHILQVPGSKSFNDLLAAAVDIGPRARVPVFLPYMNGERTPVWDPYAMGVFFGLGLSDRRGHIVRAVLEGCAFGVRQILEIGAALMNQPVHSVVSIGGGAKIAEWTQLKADVMQRRFRVLDVHDAAVVGAALLGAACAGYRSLDRQSGRTSPINADEQDPRVWKTFVPDRSADGAYDERYRVYTSLYPALKELFPLIGRQ